MSGWRPGRGALLALAIVCLDQLTKALVLQALAAGWPIRVTAFFDLVLVWNRGVSFGVFGRAPAWGPWLLIAVTLGIAGFLVAWLRRHPSATARLAIWAVLGGAAGNLLDRVRHGAVVDFLDFHVRGYHWPAFNVADSAIVLGALTLLLDELLLRAPRAETGEGRG